MTEANRGNVVLIRYHRAGEGNPWLRPALVLNSRTYREGREQLILAAITSNPVSPNSGDTTLQKWSEAGLIGPSLVTGILLTAMPTSIERVLGTLADEDMRAVEDNLHMSLVL